MLITDITQRLRDITATITTTETIGAKRAYTIAKFFRNYGDINANKEYGKLVDEALENARNCGTN